MPLNLTPLLPAIQVALTAMVVLLLDVFLEPRERRLLAWVSLIGLALGGGEAALLWNNPQGAFGDTLLLDNFGLFFTQIFIGATILTILSARDYLPDNRIHEGEFYALLLFATAGMIVMAAANDLIVFFLGLETMSMAVYVLTGIWRERSQSSEAAMKYFLVGAFATGFLLYGIALIYGASGSTHLGRISDYLIESNANWPVYLVPGVLLLLVGLAFKVGAVPFHFWVPDAYEGAPTPVTGFMSVAVKAAAFAAWARILMHAFSPLDTELGYPLRLLAIATMTFGNFLAITQPSVKRMLAYSSIAHAGYLLVALVAGEEWGGGALLYYLLAYGLMTIGAFAVVTSLAGKGETREDYADFAGLGSKRPFLATAMSLFMLSLAGFPPLAGFTGKFYVFRAAVSAGHVDLAIIGVLNSLVSVVYYLRVIVLMYMKEGRPEAKTFRQSPGLYATIGFAALGTVLVGLLPGPWLEWSRVSFASLF